MWVAFATLKKAILFFDEIHLMDRPSFMFGNFGMIGTASPIRQYEASFRENGVPLYVHEAPGGPVDGEFFEQITADVNDQVFLEKFQAGIKQSPTFRDLQIAHGNYGDVGNHENVAAKVTEVDIPAAISAHGSALNLFNDKSIRPFDFTTAAGGAKTLVSEAVTCSARINFALNVAEKQGFVPLADAAPYGDLLGTNTPEP